MTRRPGFDPQAAPAQQHKVLPELHRRALLALAGAGPAGLWLASANPAQAATPGLDEPPPPQAQRPLLLPDIDSFKLPNGLQVVVVQRTALPVVSLHLLVQAGPETDPPGRPGVAEMTSALWSKGARRAGKAVPAATLARQAEALGSGLDSASGWGASSLAMTVTRPHLAPALSLMADVLRQPLLADDELERARAQALDGLRVTLGSPAEVAALVLRRAYWGDVPHGRVAPPAALQRLRRDDLLAFQARWVRPDLAALVLVGDVDAAQARALADRWLGDWAAPAVAAPAAVAAAPQPFASPLVLVDMPGSGQSSVAVAAPYIASKLADRSERFAGLVAQAVLGGGYSARLNQEVRIQRGLSYGASGGVESFAAGGMFSARAQTAHATAGEVLQLLRHEITRLADAPPSAAELAARQASLVGSFARRLETTAGLAALLAGQWAQGRPLADLQSYVPGVLAVTPAQVQAFAKAWWPAAALRAVVVGDLAAAEPGLVAQDPAALRLSMATLDLESSSLRLP